jgi:hypothetical protein
MIDGTRSTSLTRLHAHKGAPDENSRAIQQTSNNVAKEQHEICPVLADICCEMLPQLRGARDFPVWSAEKRRFLVGRAGAAAGW